MEPHHDLKTPPPPLSPPPGLGGTRLPEYRRLRRNVILITAVVALVPPAILTAINYWQDREAFYIENNFAVSEILSNTKRNLEFVIEERRSALALLVREQAYHELASDSTLAIALGNLNDSFGGFVDLGLIDSDGKQRFYTGPYDLKGHVYTGENWFHEVVLRGVHVSDVFMGHRNFPHFVIALKQERRPGDMYIVRATIDMELVNRQVYSLNLNRFTDAFIINQRGVLQTESVFYGPVLSEVEIAVPLGPRNREVIDMSESPVGFVVSGYAFIDGTPFILMVIKRLENPLLHWLNNRSDVLWFLLVSSALILTVVVYGANQMTRRLRDADRRRVQVFHDMEYTNKMATIGRMSAGVAHEINNPMAIINEKAGLMKDMIGFSEDFPHSERMLGLIESILESVDRCSRVTHRLLGFARRIEIRKEQIDLKKLLEEVVGFQRTEMTHRNIEINFDIEDNLPQIESERGQLQQVFLNIISNAIAAIGDGGRIDISGAGRADGSVVIAITDNGVGISEENLKHIFEPFFSTKGKFGTGLGLSITRNTVEKLGGEIHVDSIPGKSTRFTVTLPAKNAGLRG
jgi:two-component system NtrC family sensor kinase